MVQRGEDFGFALKPREPFGIRSERVGQHLDRDLPLQLRVGGPIHLAHPAFADLGGDFVTPRRYHWRGDNDVDYTVGWLQKERRSLYSLHYEQSCRRPVANFDESRPPSVSSCGGRTRYCGCLGGIAAKRGGTGQGHRNTCGSAGAHVARAFG